MLEYKPIGSPIGNGKIMMHRRADALTRALFLTGHLPVLLRQSRVNPA